MFYVACEVVITCFFHCWAWEYTRISWEHQDCMVITPYIHHVSGYTKERFNYQVKYYLCAWTCLMPTWWSITCPLLFNIIVQASTSITTQGWHKWVGESVCLQDVVMNIHALLLHTIHLLLELRLESMRVATNILLRLFHEPFDILASCT